MPVASSRRNAWSAVGRVLLFFLICALLLILAGPSCSRLPGLWSQVALGSITTVATVIITGLFLRWDHLRFSDAGAAPGRQSIVRMLIGFALGLLLVALQTCFVLLAGHVHWIRTPAVSSASVATALLAYLALAFREELAFRGYPLRRLDSCFGLWSAQCVVALVFALEHVAGGATWTNAILGAFVGSLLFGMAALAMRGLAVPIGLHAAWNFGQLTLGERETSGLWKPVIEPGYSLHVAHMGVLGYLLVFGSATMAFYLAGNFQRNREPSRPKRSEVEEGLAVQANALREKETPSSRP